MRRMLGDLAYLREVLCLVTRVAVALVLSIPCHTRTQYNTFPTDEENGRAACEIRPPLILDCGSLCGLKPEVLHGAAIAFDIEGHSSVVRVAML